MVFFCTFIILIIGPLERNEDIDGKLKILNLGILIYIFPDY